MPISRQERAYLLKVNTLAMTEVMEIIPERQSDTRGFFSETFNATRFSEVGIDIEWVQDNHSLSVSKGVLRGLHYQRPPFAQAKLVRVLKGAIFDVAVDIRHGSPTFGVWCSLIVSAENWNQILVPTGFAHGLLTLEPKTEVLYKVSALYSAEHDRAINFADPDIGVDWPLSETEPILSPKDRAAPFLRDIDSGFYFQSDGAHQ